MNSHCKKFKQVLEELKNIRIIQGSSGRNRFSQHNLAQVDSKYFNNGCCISSIMYSYHCFRNELNNSFYKEEEPNKCYCKSNRNVQIMTAEKYKERTIVRNFHALRMADIVGYIYDEYKTLHYLIDYKKSQLNTDYAHLKPHKSRYILNIATNKCSCPGYLFHKCCKHSKIAREERRKIEYYTYLVLSRKIGFTITRDFIGTVNIF